MQPRNDDILNERGATFPRLAVYDPPMPDGNEPDALTTEICDRPEPTPFPAAPADATEYPRVTGFDAILDAYARDPERWDGLS